MDNIKLNRGGGHNRNCQFTHSVTKVGRDIDFAYQSKKAFTLAEVLITLVIIGVVAALTIPNIIANYQKNQYVTQLKKTYTSMTDGFHQMMAQDGVTKMTDTTFWAKMPAGTLTEAVFLTDGGKEVKEEFMKTFGVIKIYDSSTIPDDQKAAYKGLNCPSCGVSLPTDTQMYLKDGANVHLSLTKEPSVATCGSTPCKSLREFQKYRHTPTKLWRKLGNVVIDVNGAKGPNQLGRDMFYFLLGDDGNLYPKYGVDQIMSSAACQDYNNFDSCSYYWRHSTNKNYNCSTTSESAGQSCAARIMEEGWKMTY